MFEDDSDEDEASSVDVQERDDQRDEEEDAGKVGPLQILDAAFKVSKTLLVLLSLTFDLICRAAPKRRLRSRRVAASASVLRVKRTLSAPPYDPFALPSSFISFFFHLPFSVPCPRLEAFRPHHPPWH